MASDVEGHVSPCITVRGSPPSTRNPRILGGVTSRESSSFWSDRPVLVTGGCGFIGSHLVEALLDRGADVRVLGRYNSHSSWGHLTGLDDVWGDRLQVELGSVTDATFVRRVTDGVDTVFHLAALIGIPYSYAAAAHNVDVNIVGTLRVLEAAQASGVRRVVHTSTSECFGSAQYLPMDERHPLRAQSPYAATKIGADQLAQSFHRSFGTPVVTLRPFNTFGPRQSRRAVVPTIISQLLSGPDVALGSLAPIRDLNPVANTVDAFLSAGSVPDLDGDLFVIGSGVGRSVGEVAEGIAEAMRAPIRIHRDEARVRPEDSEVDRLVCDYSHAADRLGYEPTVTFAEGVAATVEYLSGLPARRDYAV